MDGKTATDCYVWVCGEAKPPSCTSRDCFWAPRRRRRSWSDLSALRVTNRVGRSATVTSPNGDPFWADLRLHIWRRRSCPNSGRYRLMYWITEWDVDAPRRLSLCNLDIIGRRQPRHATTSPHSPHLFLACVRRPDVLVELYLTQHQRSDLACTALCSSNCERSAQLHKISQRISSEQFLSRVSIAMLKVLWLWAQSISVLLIGILSVRPSVRHVPVLHRNGLTYRHNFFIHGSPIILIMSIKHLREIPHHLLRGAK